jgi:rsbT co-antagonist protein RsbR
MRLTQRQVVIGVFGLLIAGSLLFTAEYLFHGHGQDATVPSLGLLLFSGLLGLYMRGWEVARYVLLALVTGLLGAIMPEPFITQYAPAIITLVPVVALLLAGPAWVVGSSAALYVMLLVRAGGQGVYSDVTAFATFAMIVGGLVLSRLVTEGAQHQAEANAARAEAALVEAEGAAAALAQQAAELSRQNDEQRRLLDLVATLETPSVAIADGVLLAPLVGHLDSRRAVSLTERLLRDVNASRARLVVLDIAGVPAVDTGVAQALLRAVQAVRLLGCDVTLTGVSAGIAASMTELGISLAGVRTARTPQEALNRALASDAVLR